MRHPILFIIGQQDFRDEEFLTTKEFLERHGLSTVITAPTRNIASGNQGTEVQPTLAIPEVDSSAYLGVVFIGGPGVKTYANMPEATHLALGFHQQRKIVGGIGAAVRVLANAGVLIGRRVTGLAADEELFLDRGAEFSGMNVERDGHVITAKDRTAATQFAQEFVRALGG